MGTRNVLKSDLERTRGDLRTWKLTPLRLAPEALGYSYPTLISAPDNRAELITVSGGLGAGLLRWLGFAETREEGVQFGQWGEGESVMNWLKTRA